MTDAALPTALPTIVEALARNAARTPLSAAYVDAQGEIPFADLWQAVQRRAAWMFAMGVRAGDVVALAMEGSVDASAAQSPQAVAGPRRALELLYAGAALGAVVLPLYPHLPQAACEEMMTRFAARWLIARGAPPQVAGARSLDPRGFEAVPASFDAAPAPRGDTREAGLLYSFTSGTSGSPKVLLFTHAQFHDNCHAAARAIGMEPGDRQMPSVPWPSSVALRYLMRAHVCGATFITETLGHSREEAAHNLARYRANRAAASPWQLRRLVQSAAPPGEMPPLRSLHLTGAFVTPEELAAASAALTPNLYVGYGSIEVGAATLMLPGEAAPGCVGRLIDGVEGRVEDAQGNLLEPGETGELSFRAPWMCHGYADNPQVSAERFRGGWFYPRDIGTVDARGHVWLLGRSVEVINFGGQKIWPEEVEAVLKRYPAVADAAVAALPDPMSGQVAVAFVVPGGGSGSVLDGAGLRAFCERYLEATRIPPHVVVVESIARNEAGKVLREQMVREHQAHLEAALAAARQRARPV